MEEKKSDLLYIILVRLKEIGLLDHLIIVGSWCLHFYKSYFDDYEYFSTIKTRDIDFYIPTPLKFKRKIDFNEIVKDLGFVMNLRGEEGFISFENPYLIIEFLVAEKGRGSSKPVEIKQLGINAQALRYLNILSDNTTTVKYKGIDLNVPTPWCFALHKLLISSRRKTNEKRENDRSQAIKLLNDLLDHNKENEILSTYKKLPHSWRKRIIKELHELGEVKILEILHRNQ